MSAEFRPASDSTCDRCLRTNGPLKWHPIGMGRNFLCADCIAHQDEAEAVEESLEAAWKAEGYINSLQVYNAEGR